MTEVTETGRRPWAALASLLLAALSGAASALLYLSAAFADRNFDVTTWQLTVGTLAGLTLAALSSAVILVGLPVRPPKVWLLPAAAFALPIVFFGVISLTDG